MHENEFLKLYKYRSLSGNHGRDTAQNIILHHRMFWQSPLEFNDPFDCDPVVIFGRSEKERLDWIKRANASNVDITNRLQRRNKKRELIQKPPDQHELEMRVAWREWMAETAVSCFSSVNDHQLMWGHYADSHKGVCFAFEEQYWRNEGWIAFDVSYSSIRPVVNLTQLRDADVMRDSLLNKSDVWDYEREFRMIEWRKRPGIREFPEKALKGVILGARISDCDRDFIIDLAGKRPHLKIWKAECDPSQFRLNIVNF